MLQYTAFLGVVALLFWGDPVQSTCAVSYAQQVREGLLIADNILSCANTPNDIQVLNRKIIIPTSAAGDRLKVKLANPGQLNSHSKVEITATVIAPSSGTSWSPMVGITNGVETQMFKLTRPDDYGSTAVCIPYSRPSDPTPPDDATYDNIVAGSGASFVVEYKLLFSPLAGYGTCSTAQNGGYVTTGDIAHDLDVALGLFLIVRRNVAADQIYEFLSFQVKIF